ncbi:hypothetical protein CKA32_003673 [Geitlerinema sp. FC II]|nr:hypothetical protein CKA32_003673 [Geitlerinema sp. FC II]
MDEFRETRLNLVEDCFNSILCDLSLNGVNLGQDSINFEEGGDRQLDRSRTVRSPFAREENPEHSPSPSTSTESWYNFSPNLSITPYP